MAALRHVALGLPLALMACGPGPAGPGPNHPALVQFATTAHYVFHAAPGDSIDTAWQEQYHEWLTAALEVASPTRLEYYKYRDVAHLEALTGHESGTGFAEDGGPRFHTIWPIDNHEAVHALVMLQIGHPPPLFNEGVAVAHQTFPDRGRLTPTWNGTDLHQLARGFLETQRLPALTSLLRGSDFIAQDANVTYPSAGSFVRYLIDTHGLAPFKSYVSAARADDDATTTRGRVATAYGRSLDELWAEWRAWLVTTPASR
jgi:hypothetical protein